MMGGMFGAAGSVAGAFIAADAQKYSANTNWAIALTNYYQRERERTEARMEAQRQEAKGDLGSTNIQGDTTKFVPGVGWVQTPSDATASLMGRQRNEQMQQFGDLAVKRRQMQANVGQQIQERDKSQALLDEMKHTQTPTVSQLQNMIIGAQSPAINRAFDETANIGARQALRTGTNPTKVMSEIARARSQEQAGMSGQALTQAMSMAPQLEGEQKKMQANLYNLFATRASAQPDVSFSPQQLDTSSLAQAQRGSSNSGELALKAAMMEGGRMPYMPPLYGTANAVGALGAAGQGLARNMQGYGQPQFSDGGGYGMLADAASRVRGDAGAWS